jgi:autotransporter-associated beta strand protein
MSHKALFVHRLRSITVLLTPWLLSAAMCVFGSGLSWAEDFNWRDVGGLNFVTSVKNQNPAGTCWAFAPVGALEAKYKITRNDPSFNPNMSEQNLVCAGGMGDSSWGHADRALNYFTSTGIVSELELTYTAQNTSTQWPLQSGWENRVWKSTSNQNTLPSYDANYLKTMLKTNGPLVTGLYTSTDWYTGPGTGVPGTPDKSGHYVVIVGFHDDLTVAGGGYWIVKNSWGTDFGDNGYGKLTYALTEYRQWTHMIDGAVYYADAMATATWQDGSGTWSAGDSSHWIKDASPYAWENMETAAIFNYNSAPYSININGTAIAHSLTFNSSAYSVNINGGSLTVTGGGIAANNSVWINCPVTIGAPQTWTTALGKTLTIGGSVHTIISPLTVDVAGDSYINGVIDGAGGLTKNGSATLTLSAGNIYTGPTTINQGIIKLGTQNALPTSTKLSISPQGSTSQLDLAGYNQSIGSLDISLPNSSSGTQDVVVNSVGNGTLTLGGNVIVTGGGNDYPAKINTNINLGPAKRMFYVPDIAHGSGDLQIIGSISGLGGLEKTDTGKLTLIGGSTYSGGTDVNGGILALGHDSANDENADALGTGPVTINNSAQLRFGGKANSIKRYDISNDIVINDGTIFSNDGEQHLQGNITINGSSTIHTEWKNKDVYVEGQISGTGELKLTSAGGNGSPGIVHLKNANPFSGTINIRPQSGSGGGLLSVENNNALSNATVEMDGRHGMYFTVADPVFGALSGTGNFVLPTGSLTVGGNNSFTTFSGQLSSDNPNTLFTKTGYGNLILSGVNTYAGYTLVDEGYLTVNKAASLPGYNVPNKVAVNNDFATLMVRVGASTGEWIASEIDDLRNNVAIAEGGYLGFDTTSGNFPYESSIGGNLGIYKWGINNLRLNGLSIYHGFTSIGDGTLEIAGGIGSGGTTFIEVWAGKAVFMNTNITKPDLDINTEFLGTFEVLNHTHEVGNITGDGITQVDNGAMLTAASFHQNTLTIGSGAKFVIRPRPGGPFGGLITPVPEPAAFASIVGAFILMACAWAKKKARKRAGN